MSRWWRSSGSTDDRGESSGARSKNTSFCSSKAIGGGYPYPDGTGKTTTMVEPVFDYQFRVILIGDSSSGKSSLLRRYTDGVYAEVSDATVGVDFFAKLVKMTDGSWVKLQLWDTAGQERFRSITKSYYRNSVGVILVYDVTSAQSFLNVPNWMESAQKYIGPRRPVVVLVGCKRDLRTGTGKKGEVNFNEARRLAERLGGIAGVVETSAKTGEAVGSAFQLLSQNIYDKVKNGEYPLQDDGWDGIKRGYFSSSGYFGTIWTGGNSGGVPGRQRHISSTPINNSVVTMNLLEADPVDRRFCC